VLPLSSAPIIWIEQGDLDVEMLPKFE
jgi:hypothetical protein